MAYIRARRFTPEPRVEITPQPRRNYTWATGHWEWRNRRHVWVAGSWLRGDRDGDGIPDRVDRDRDGDGVRNSQDPRPDNPRRY